MHTVGFRPPRTGGWIEARTFSALTTSGASRVGPDRPEGNRTPLRPRSRRQLRAAVLERLRVLSRHRGPKCFPGTGGLTSEFPKWGAEERGHPRRERGGGPTH